MTATEKSELGSKCPGIAVLLLSHPGTDHHVQTSVWERGKWQEGVGGRAELLTIGNS